ncbi:MAG: HesA/MoeB/ThiF family protein [Candidatus Aminicenantes bacterium]|nr:HesA/MoeB/ThiF family protein [Candidatus Aminicenantes bacterium]
MLRDDETERYGRQLLIPGWSQESLSGATVLIVGLGGLGSASALYLSAAGVGKLRICDGDKVERSDLNRQVLYSESSLGLPKVEEASRRIIRLNPFVSVEKRDVFVDTENAAEMIAGCQVIIDGLDNLKTRFILNEEALKQRIPFVYGAVQGWQGYVGFFHPPLTACLACLMRPDFHTRDRIPVSGVTPGTIGLIQASEVIKWLMGMPPSLLGRLLIYDGTDLSFETIRLEKNPDCPVCSKP